jgi:hypothetical protein
MIESVPPTWDGSPVIKKELPLGAYPYDGFGEFTD